MKSKKIIAFLAAVAITGSVLPVSVMAEEETPSDIPFLSETDISDVTEVSEKGFPQFASGEYSSDNYEYSVDSEGKATITKYTGTESDVVIPAALGKYPVAYIGVSAFCDNDKLVTVTIGSNIKSIGDNAFALCDRLSEIIIPDSVTELGETAFNSCVSLKKAVIGSGVTEIKYSAFGGCKNLASVTIGKNVSVIRADAFRGTGISGTLTIPDSVTNIDNAAFFGCGKITGISFGKKLKKIDTDAFCGCISLLSVTFPNSLTELGNSVFFECTSIKKVTFGTGMSSTGCTTFEGCTALTDIVFSSGITTIDKCAFKRCTGLKKVVFPDTVKYIGNEAFAGCSSLSYVDFGKGVDEIGGFAFSGCGSLTDVVIPDTLSAISGSFVFEGCGLKTATFGKQLVDIGYAVMQGCSGLTDVVIKEGVLHVTGHSFNYCTGLKRMYIPSTILDIGIMTFYNMDGADFDIYYGGSKSDWDNVGIHFSNERYMENCTVYYDCPEPVTITSIVFSGSAPTLQWTAAAGVGSYRIYRSEDLSGELTYIGKTTDRIFTDNTAVGGKKYYYHVMAYKDSDSFSYSIPKKVTVPVSVPALPTVKANAGNAKVALYWNAVSNATKYKVFYRVNGTSAWTSKDTTLTSYTISGLTNGKKYDILVLAGNANGWSKWTNSNIIYAAPSVPIPALPTVKTVTGDSKVTLSWNKISGAVKYRVFYRLNGTSTWTYKDTTATSYTVSGLKNGKKYDLLVLANNGTEWSSWTKNSIVYATPAASGAPALPAVKAAAGDSKATLSWNKVSGAVKYRVFYRVSGTSAWTTKDTTSTSYTVSGLTNGKKYDFLVLAGSTNAWSKWTSSDIINATPASSAVPALPAVKAASGNAQTVLSWNKVSGAVKYRVFYRVSGTSAWTTKDTTATSYTVKGLTNGKKYDFLVLAGSTNAWSKWTNSNIINATPLAAPALPAVKASAGNASVALSWNAVTGASKYRVFYRVSGTSTWTTKDITSTSYTITGLTNGKKYEILVLAGSTNAWSKYTSSNIINAVPKA